MDLIIRNSDHLKTRLRLCQVWLPPSLHLRVHIGNVTHRDICVISKFSVFEWQINIQIFYCLCYNLDEIGIFPVHLIISDLEYNLMFCFLWFFILEQRLIFFLYVCLSLRYISYFCGYLVSLQDSLLVKTSFLHSLIMYKIVIK